MGELVKRATKGYADLMDEYMKKLDTEAKQVYLEAKKLVPEGDKAGIQQLLIQCHTAMNEGMQMAEEQRKEKWLRKLLRRDREALPPTREAKNSPENTRSGLDTGCFRDCDTHLT